jgi:hypothetical protein
MLRDITAMQNISLSFASGHKCDHLFTQVFVVVVDLEALQWHGY